DRRRDSARGLGTRGAGRRAAADARRPGCGRTSGGGARLRDPRRRLRSVRRPALLLLQDRVADLDALVADVDPGRAGDQRGDVVASLLAERAALDVPSASRGRGHRCPNSIRSAGLPPAFPQVFGAAPAPGALSLTLSLHPQPQAPPPDPEYSRPPNP